MSDAKFEDGGEAPIQLVAVDAEDLAVISTLTQDAVFPITEMRYDRAHRRFALLINRFRWEDRAQAERRNRPVERVQAMLVVGDVTHVASQGIDRSQKDMVLSLLSLSWEPGEDGTGRLILTLAGDGTIALETECLDVSLTDVTRPYIAPSRHVPDHPE